MNTNPSKEQLLARINKLERDAARQKRHENINQALFRISNAVNTTASLPDLYVSIHESLGHIIDTTNFFIATYTPEDDSVEFPYCVDQVDGCLQPVNNFSKTGSLTAEVIRTAKPMMLNKQQILDFRARAGLAVPKCSPSEIWLGAPLRSGDEIIGAIAVQSYTDTGLYDETDLSVLMSVADQIAFAIERKRSEEKRENLIKDLHAALEEVKTLQGILPICSKCKNIRDDKGSWKKIEAYIKEHSDADFSHGLCPVCAEELYGGEDWYKELQKDE